MGENLGISDVRVELPQIFPETANKKFHFSLSKKPNNPLCFYFHVFLFLFVSRKVINIFPLTIFFDHKFLFR